MQDTNELTYEDAFDDYLSNYQFETYAVTRVFTFRLLRGLYKKACWVDASLRGCAEDGKEYAEHIAISTAEHVPYMPSSEIDRVTNVLVALPHIIKKWIKADVKYGDIPFGNGKSEALILPPPEDWEGSEVCIITAGELLQVWIDILHSFRANR